MDGLVSLLWRFKPNTVLNCCVVIKGNAFPALVPALTSDTDEELRGYFRINHSHLKNSENNTFLLILKKNPFFSG